MHIENWANEILNFSFFLIILWEARVIYGREIANIFLWGSILWTGIIENMNVMIGGYDYFAYANYYSFGGKIIEGYGGYLAWVLFVPLCICIGWFILSFPAFVISFRLFGGKANIWLKAAFGGLILVSLDLLIDPIAVVNEWWRWTMPGLQFFGVPIGNWLGWFFLLFYFAAVFERTVLQRKGFRWLNKIEKLIFRADTSDLSGWDIGRIGRVFYVRIIAYLPVFFLTLVIVNGITTELWNNRYAPYNNVFPHPAGMERYYTPPEGVVPPEYLPPHLKAKYLKTIPSGGDK